jgi:bifunctional non-homologous end joining protein LigD
MAAIEDRVGHQERLLMNTANHDPDPSVTGSSQTPDFDVDPLIAPPGLIFVLQQHHATRLHHDFRLEMMNGEVPVLVSWAVPKGLPRRRGDRHLAIRTPDHSMEHANFSGSIPEDEYGGGQVRIFDHGAYEIVERSEDRLTFNLEGERLNGVWHLIFTDHKDGKEQWLAMMREDRRPDPEPRPSLEPMLATLASEPFDDQAWGFEPKWDGIRALAVCDEGTRLVSRNEHDVTVAYPELHRIHEQLVALDAILDGEIVAFENGVPSFQRLQSRMHLRDEKQIGQMAKSIPVAYMIFDILYLDGKDLTGLPLGDRQQLLTEVVVPTDHVQVSPVVPESGTALFSAASEQGLEGIMAKRLTSNYQPGVRSRDWLKVKVTFDADVVIVGWTDGEGRRAGTLGSLVMAVYDAGGLRYVGNVGTGFDRRSLDDALDRLGALEDTVPPFGSDVVRSRSELRRTHWVVPSLVATVEHRQLTGAGRLRSPSFKGFREDKEPEECTYDQLVAEAGS